MINQAPAYLTATPHYLLPKTGGISTVHSQINHCGVDISFGAPREFVRPIFFVFYQCEQCNDARAPDNKTKTRFRLRATVVIAHVRTGPVRSSPPQPGRLFNIFKMAKDGYSP